MAKSRRSRRQIIRFANPIGHQDSNWDSSEESVPLLGPVSDAHPLVKCLHYFKQWINDERDSILCRARPSAPQRPAKKSPQVVDKYWRWVDVIYKAGSRENIGVAKMLIDTQGGRNLVSRRLIERLGMPVRPFGNGPQPILEMANGSMLSSFGTVELGWAVQRPAENSQWNLDCANNTRHGTFCVVDTTKLDLLVAQDDINKYQLFAPYIPTSLPSWRREPPKVDDNADKALERQAAEAAKEKAAMEAHEQAKDTTSGGASSRTHGQQAVTQ